MTGWHLAIFLTICGLIELWTLWRGLEAEPGKAWPWFAACVADCVIAIVVGTFIALQLDGAA